MLSAMTATAACADRETLFGGGAPAAAPRADSFDADARMKRAHAALDAKDYDGAEKLAREVVAHDDKDADAYVVLGDVKLARHANDEALALFDKAIAIDPADDWATVRACEALGALGRHAEARDRLRAFAAAHAKASEDLYDALGWAELDGHDPARAEAAFRRALEVTGDKDADAWYGLALVAADKGDAAAAERALRECFARDPARRIEASKEDGLDSVRSSPGIRALFTKDKLDEARRAAPDAGK
jgi:tetratricopeptide (TPR) repeat protein